MSAVPLTNSAMVRRSKCSNYRKLKKLTTLDYFMMLIKAKPRLSSLDDLGLALFDAIVAFQQPLAFRGSEWCLGVPVDPKFIHVQKYENQLFLL